MVNLKGSNCILEVRARGPHTDSGFRVKCNSPLILCAVMLLGGGGCQSAWIVFAPRRSNPRFSTGLKQAKKVKNKSQPSFVSSWLRKAVDYGGRGCVEDNEG